MKLADFIGGTGPQTIPEFGAEGENERVYHETRQTLRVTGVHLLFQTWAGFGKFLPLMWDELRPNLETVVFEEAGKQVRDEASKAVEGLGETGAGGYGELGESRAWQIRAALDLYDYINPKLLVLTSAVHQALQGVHIGSGAVSQAGKLPRGEPARMYAMELEEEKGDDSGVRRTLKDLRKAMALDQVSSDYRTLALWPDYLDGAWQRLKPVMKGEAWKSASDRLRDLSRNLARGLPFPIAMTMGRVKEIGEDPEKVRQTTEEFERVLPMLILNIAMLKSDWRRMEQAQAASAGQLSSHPEPTHTGSTQTYPASESLKVHDPPPESKAGGSLSSRGAAMLKALKGRRLVPGETPAHGHAAESGWRIFQKRQRLAEYGDRFVSYIEEGSGEPLILLHGMPTWGFLWESSIANLSSRFRVIAPDLLGFGYSDKRDAFDRSLARQTEMLEKLLGKMGVESAHFIGHDLGGGIALRFATLLPKRVRSLCLLNSVCYDSWPVEAILQLKFSSNYCKVPAARSLKILRNILRTAFNSEPENDWFDGLLSPWRTEVGKLSLLRNVAALNTNETTELTRLLPGINVPTLIIWGEDDPLLPVKYGQRLAKDIPGATFVRIAGARHYVMVDQPERVHGAMNEFFERQVFGHGWQQAAA